MQAPRALCEDTSTPDGGQVETEARGPANPAPDSEDDQEFFYGAESDIDSVYVRRGIQLTNKPVSQPSV